MTTRVTLVMTILNEDHSLPDFLSSLSAQDRVPDELIVVDGGSLDNSVQLVETWGRNNPVPVRVVCRPGCNIAEGRNIGVGYATCEVVAVTDAGTCLDRAWLQKLIDAVDAGADVAAGFFYPAGDTWLQRLIAVVTIPTLKEVKPSRFLPSSRSVAFMAKNWRAVGGYPEWLDYCEDIVFDLSLKQQGAIFSFVPDALVAWKGRASLRDFSRQYFRYARGDGEAGLWPKRHALRYLTYFTLTVTLVVPRAAPLRLPALLLWWAYVTKYLRRVIAQRKILVPHTGRALLLTPIVVAVGDLSKMGGYPVGRLRRLVPSPGKNGAMT